MTVLTFSVDTTKQIHQEFMAGKRPIVHLTDEQRRLIDNFHPTRQEINEAYAKARKKVERDGRL